MTRIGAAYGADSHTFLTLAGVGDLFLTCSSPTSRNYTVGYRLGKGENLDDIIRTLGSVAEGVTTAKALNVLIHKLGVRAPIATAIYEVLYEGTDLKTQAQELMARPSKIELDLPSPTKNGPLSVLQRKLGLTDTVSS